MTVFCLRYSRYFKLHSQEPYIYPPHVTKLAMQCSHVPLNSFGVNIKFLVGSGFHALHPILKYISGRTKPPLLFMSLGHKCISTRNKTWEFSHPTGSNWATNLMWFNHKFLSMSTHVSFCDVYHAVSTTSVIQCWIVNIQQEYEIW
jgi:hypothetical protein